MSDNQEKKAIVETSMHWFPPPGGGGLDLHLLSDGRVMVETVDPKIVGGSAATLYAMKDGKWEAENIPDWPELKPYFDRAKYDGLRTTIRTESGCGRTRFAFKNVD